MGIKNICKLSSISDNLSLEFYVLRWESKVSSEKAFICQERFDCIPECFLTSKALYWNICNVSFMVELFRLLQIVFASLYSKKLSLDGHFRYFHFNLDLLIIIITLLIFLVMNGAWLPLIVLVSHGACLSSTYLNTFVKAKNLSLWSLYISPFSNSWSSL